jgi:hypothetical protein
MTNNRDLVGAAADAGSGVETGGEALEKVEERKLPPPDGGGPEPQCGYCAARFWTRESLAEHVYQAHSGPRPPPTAEALAAKDREIAAWKSVRDQWQALAVKLEDRAIAAEAANTRLTSQVEKLMEVVGPFARLADHFKLDDARKGLAFTTPNLSSSDFRALRTVYDSIKEGLGEAAADAEAGVTGPTANVAQRIVQHLFRIQQRGLERDTGHGIASAREIGLAVGLKSKAARGLLSELAERGEVRRCDAINGTFWQSVNPLPWEPGGKWPGQAARELLELKVKAGALSAELTQVLAAIAKAQGGPVPNGASAAAHSNPSTTPNTRGKVEERERIADQDDDGKLRAYLREERAADLGLLDYPDPDDFLSDEEKRG